MLFLPIFGGQLQKNMYFYLQSFNAKTDQLSFLFAIVCKAWWWYYWFGCDASFTKSDKKDWILSSAPQNADFAGFWLPIEKKNLILISKFQCKN